MQRLPDRGAALGPPRPPGPGPVPGTRPGQGLLVQGGQHAGLLEGATAGLISPSSPQVCRDCLLLGSHWAHSAHRILLPPKRVRDLSSREREESSLLGKEGNKENSLRREESCLVRGGSSFGWEESCLRREESLREIENSSLERGECSSEDDGDWISMAEVVNTGDEEGQQEGDVDSLILEESRRGLPGWLGGGEDSGEEEEESSGLGDGTDNRRSSEAALAVGSDSGVCSDGPGSSSPPGRPCVPSISSQTAFTPHVEEVPVVDGVWRGEVMALSQGPRVQLWPLDKFR